MIHRLTDGWAIAYARYSIYAVAPNYVFSIVYTIQSP